jgi:hypothetical protein
LVLIVVVVIGVSALLLIIGSAIVIGICVRKVSKAQPTMADVQPAMVEVPEGLVIVQNVPQLPIVPMRDSGGGMIPLPASFDPVPAFLAPIAPPSGDSASQ